MKSERHILWCVIYFTIIKTTNCVSQDIDSTSEILKFWEEQDDQFKVGTKKDIIIFLGDTGSGKSTVISLLSGIELQSVETNSGSGAFNIVDNKGRVTCNSTVVSQTLTPEFIMDREWDVAYFDCPGFEDTRGVKFDITTAFLIKQAIESADSVKIVFVISHNSVSAGEDRHGILKLAKQANELIANNEKFSDSIGLIVTKVENRRIPHENSTFELVNDEKLIDGIYNFLGQAKEALKGLNSKEDTSSYDQKINEMGIKFIDILLRNGFNGQPRIRIFRKPLKASSISEMTLLQGEKESTKKQINQNLKFIRRADGDFRHSIADASKIRLSELINEEHCWLIYQ